MPAQEDLCAPEVRALIDGYVAGYNQFLADTGTDAVVGSCGGQAWLRPISALDLFAYYVDLGLLGSSNAMGSTRSGTGRAEFQPASQSIAGVKSTRCWM